MSDAEDKALREVLAEVRALKFPLDLINRVLILSDLLQRSLTKSSVTEDSLRQLLGEVHHDLEWLRKNVAEMNRLLSAIVTTDEPGKNGD